MKRHIHLAAAAALLVATAGAAQAQAAREPASMVLLEHFQKAMVDWEKGPDARNTHGLAGAQSAFAQFDWIKVRMQMRDLGTAVAPLIPKMADMLLNTGRNHYDLAFMIYGATAEPARDKVPEVIARVSDGHPAEKLAALAQLGRSSSPEGFEVLRAAARGGDPLHRLMATVGLGMAGQKVFPEVAARTVATNLRDPERYVRQAAANGIRSIGAPAQVVAPEVIDYLRTKDNPFMATAALMTFPAGAVRPAKADLEALAADPTTTVGAKRQVIELLMLLETSKPAAAL